MCIKAIVIRHGPSPVVFSTEVGTFSRTISLQDQCRTTTGPDSGHLTGSTVQLFSDSARQVAGQEQFKFPNFIRGCEHGIGLNGNQTVVLHDGFLGLDHGENAAQFLPTGFRGSEDKESPSALANEVTDALHPLLIPLGKGVCIEKNDVEVIECLRLLRPLVRYILSEGQELVLPHPKNRIEFKPLLGGQDALDEAVILVHPVGQEQYPKKLGGLNQHHGMIRVGRGIGILQGAFHCYFKVPGARLLRFNIKLYSLLSFRR